MMLDAGPAAEVVKKKRVVVEHEGREILVLAHEGRFYAFENRCIHKERELAKGMVFQGKLVCPGHQWAFDLDTGFEAVKGQCQPMYDVAVVDDRVHVDAGSRRVRVPAGDARPVDTAASGDPLA